MTINHGKQLHSMRAEVVATPQGTTLLTVPKKSFIYDVIFDNKNNIPATFYKDCPISVGVAGNQEYITKKTDLSKSRVTRAALGDGAGFQSEETVLRVFWHYEGKGHPTSGLIQVLVLFDLS